MNEAAIEAFIRNAVRVDVSYTVNGLRRNISIRGQSKIDDLMKDFFVDSTEKNTFVGLAPYSLLVFVSEDNKAVEAMFVKPDNLDVFHWGQIYLPSAKFYSNIERIISLKEGRKINILANN